MGAGLCGPRGKNTVQYVNLGSTCSSVTAKASPKDGATGELNKKTGKTSSGTESSAMSQQRKSPSRKHMLSKQHPVSSSRDYSMSGRTYSTSSEQNGKNYGSSDKEGKSHMFIA